MHQRAIEEVTQEEVTQDLVQQVALTGPRFKAVVAVLGILFLLGVVGFLTRLQGGFADRGQWGYYAATFVFLLTSAQGAPVASVATRLVKGHWRRPLTRAAELFAVVGVFNFLLFLPLLALIPPLEGRRSIWMWDWPGAPFVLDTVAVATLAITGLALLYIGSLPDLAILRDHASGGRRALFERLALGWRGTVDQWRVLQSSLNILGAFYLMFLVFVHFLISVDFAMSLVPGWVDAIFPAAHALGGLQSAVATTILALGFLRWFGGYRRYIGLDQFWGLAKLLLALSLLWFYFWWSSFIVMWYGRKPVEQALLQLLMFGPYLLPFLGAFLFNFVLPLLLLMWNPVRVSIGGPFLVAILVLIGNFFDRVRLYVAAFSVEEVMAFELEHVPAAHLPDLTDLLIIMGGMTGAILVYLLATRLVSAVSMWEMKEGLILSRARPFGRSHVVIIAKPY